MLMLLYTNATLCYTNALAQASKHQTDMVRSKFSCVLQKLRPWNMITAKHESCLCKSCENFGCYEKGLAKALELLPARRWWSNLKWMSSLPSRTVPTRGTLIHIGLLKQWTVVMAVVL